MEMGGVRNRGGDAVSSGGNVSLTDVGADGGWARWRDGCRFPNGIFGELREDLPHHLSFTLHMSCSMLACKGEVVKVIEAFIDGRVGRSVGGSESRLEWLKEWHSSVGCQGVFSLQLK